jgi:hypothetical protein
VVKVRVVVAERHQSPGGDKRLSIEKPHDFAARVHWIVIREHLDECVLISGHFAVKV